MTKASRQVEHLLKSRDELYELLQGYKHRWQMWSQTSVEIAKNWWVSVRRRVSTQMRKLASRLQDLGRTFIKY